MSAVSRSAAAVPVASRASAEGSLTKMSFAPPQTMTSEPLSMVEYFARKSSTCWPMLLTLMERFEVKSSVRVPSSVVAPP